ncbi:hypothetical protein OC834_000538 [Tilletia horrida]|nr:hypothetical protein OC834_000538 [Tilletia horrida]
MGGDARARVTEDDIQRSAQNPAQRSTDGIEAATQAQHGRVTRAHSEDDSATTAADHLHTEHHSITAPTSTTSPVLKLEEPGASAVPTMFGEDRSQSPRMPSPWTARLSASLDNAASRGPSPLSLDAAASAAAPGGTQQRRTSNSRSSQQHNGHHHPPVSISEPSQPDLHLSSANHSPSLAPLNPEEDTIGNIEYKLKLLPPTRDRFNRLVTQLKWRLLQGGGMAIYEIGVLDDGALVGLSRREMRASLDTLEAMALHLGARVEVRRVIVVQRYSHGLATTPPSLGAPDALPSPLPEPGSSLGTAGDVLVMPNGVNAGALPAPLLAQRAAFNPAAPEVISQRTPRRKSSNHGVPTFGNGANLGPSSLSSNSSISASPHLLPLALQHDSPSVSYSPPMHGNHPALRRNSSSNGTATVAQINAANKVLNEAYLLRELGAKRRGSRAGPTDIVHLGLLDAVQARKWIGGGKRTFSADMRLDLPKADTGSASAADVPTLVPGSGSSSRSGKLGAEMALPLVVLAPEALAREIEHDRMLEQWEEELKRRRAETAAAALLLIQGGDTGSLAGEGSGGSHGSPSGRASQRQRRRKNHGHAMVFEGDSPTLGDAPYFGQIKKPWLPEVADGAGQSPGDDVAISPAPLQPAGDEHAKEGSGPVRIAGAPSARFDDRARDCAGADGLPSSLDLDGDGVSSDDADEAGDGDGAASGGSNDEESDADSDDDDAGFFSFSLSLSDDEDGQIKGGRKKQAKNSIRATKNGAARPQNGNGSQAHKGGTGTCADPRQSIDDHDPIEEGSPSAVSAPLGVLSRSRSPGSQRKAENRAAALEVTLVRAAAAAAVQQPEQKAQERLVQPGQLPSNVDLAVAREPSAADGSSTSTSTPLAMSAPSTPAGGISSSVPSVASTTAAGLSTADESAQEHMTIRFIVEAKVLRKLRKGDVFIDYAGI